ncbi:hypothetical protein PAXINDRAFT_11192 [Paxillus involutus ATCC 200175]|nr:hypothetical protein PAXINDRAFT_11192 [Paxillus involutus ATCC 200175]
MAEADAEESESGQQVKTDGWKGKQKAIGVRDFMKAEAKVLQENRSTGGQATKESKQIRETEVDEMEVDGGGDKGDKGTRGRAKGRKERGAKAVFSSTKRKLDGKGNHDGSSESSLERLPLKKKQQPFELTLGCSPTVPVSGLRPGWRSNTLNRTSTQPVSAPKNQCIQEIVDPLTSRSQPAEHTKVTFTQRNNEGGIKLSTENSSTNALTFNDYGGLEDADETQDPRTHMPHKDVQMDSVVSPTRPTPPCCTLTSVSASLFRIKKIVGHSPNNDPQLGSVEGNEWNRDVPHRSKAKHSVDTAKRRDGKRRNDSDTQGCDRDEVDAAGGDERDGGLKREDDEEVHADGRDEMDDGLGRDGNDNDNDDNDNDDNDNDNDVDNVVDADGGDESNNGGDEDDKSNGGDDEYIQNQHAQSDKTSEAMSESDDSITAPIIPRQHSTLPVKKAPAPKANAFKIQEGSRRPTKDSNGDDEEEDREPRGRKKKDKLKKFRNEDLPGLPKTMQPWKDIFLPLFFIKFAASNNIWDINTPFWLKRAQRLWDKVFPHHLHTLALQNEPVFFLQVYNWRGDFGEHVEKAVVAFFERCGLVSPEDIAAYVEWACPEPIEEVNHRGKRVPVPAPLFPYMWESVDETNPNEPVPKGIFLHEGILDVFALYLEIVHHLKDAGKYKYKASPGAALGLATVAFERALRRWETGQHVIPLKGLRTFFHRLWGYTTEEIMNAVDRLSERKWKKILNRAEEFVGAHKPLPTGTLECARLEVISGRAFAFEEDSE